MTCLHKFFEGPEDADLIYCSTACKPSASSASVSPNDEHPEDDDEQPSQPSEVQPEDVPNTTENGKQVGPLQQGVEDLLRKSFEESVQHTLSLAMKLENSRTSVLGIAGVAVLNDDTAVKLTIGTETTAFPCSCADSSCRALIKIGEYGKHSNGQLACPHCGALPKTRDGTVKTAWSKVDFDKHVRSETCQSKQLVRFPQGLAPSKELQKKSKYLRGFINHVSNETIKDGKKYFKCPSCQKTVLYSGKYSHSMRCFNKNSFKVPSWYKGEGY